GGMGVVYRAHDLLLDRDVAIKLLRKAGLGTEGKARLEREARAAAQLNHPNIVSIYDAGESDEQPFIIMELVEGQALNERPPENLAQALQIAAQVCAALEHAHQRGVVHRDLKPENVLVSPHGQVKLMDFGMARSMTSRLTVEGSIEGTVLYLAPEQALGQAVDRRADLYSLGVMLYELVVGELPYTSDHPLAVISQHLYAPIPSPRARREQLPPALDALIVRLMSKQPGQRPASAGEVELLLQGLLAGEGGGEQAAAESPLDRVVRGRLVGRQRELGQAIEAWNAAAAPAAGGSPAPVLLLSGDPGIGKTRLATELIAHAQVHGARVLKGDCYADDGSPYAPLHAILEAAAGSGVLERLGGLPDLLALAPQLRARFSGVQPNALLDVQAEQQRLYESFVELAAALSAQAPLLLVLEDAHWADSGTLALLRHLARRAAALRLRLLALVTYREVELDEARGLNQVLYDLGREQLALRIKLGRLDRAGTAALLQTLLAADIPDAFVESIYRETEGNPFFTEELCKALIESGRLARTGAGWQWPVVEQMEAPQSIRVAIQARVGKLPAQAQEALRTASIFGREFTFELLQAVSEMDEDDLLQALEAAQRAQLIGELQPGGRKRGGVRYAFAHALIASTLRESMSGVRRKRLHRRAGQSIERLYPEHLDELAPYLGRHFAEAGEWDQACRYLLIAGDHAQRVYAYPEAIEYYQHALGILKEEQDLQRAARTLMKLGLIYHTTLDFARSRQAYKEGFALWKEASQAPLPQPPPAPHPLRLAYYPPITLDPMQAFEVVSVPVIDQLFSGLLALNPDAELTPELAESWEVQENGKRYVFHLRQDAFWSDGQPVTAHDVAFTWKRILNPATKSRHPVLFYDIRGARAYHQGQVDDPAAVGVHATDDYTLVVELEQPAGYFLHLLSYSATFPALSHRVTELGDAWAEPENIVTSGPFLLEEWRQNDRLVLRRSPRYYGQRLGNLEQVEIYSAPVYQHFAARLAAYHQGKLDVLFLGGSALEADRARQQHAGEYISLPAATVGFIVFDTTRPPFDDARVRRAFTHALDRETLAEVVGRGFSAPASGGLTPPGLPGHAPQVGLPYDPLEARRLLADAGYEHDSLPEIEFWTLPRDSTAFSDAISEQWLENLGVSVRFVELSNNELFDRIQTEPPPLYMNGWLADYPDPDTFLRVCLAYESRWRHADYEQLVDQARRTVDQAERLGLYQQAERLLAQEAPLLLTTYGRLHLLVKPWLRRYPISPFHYFIFKDVILEPHA
ncbi:MAG: ABC transporter substrate-binding protein, partial [Chloroflexota bacterium]